MLYAYFGHHKCASTWIVEILEQICREAGLKQKVIVDPATPNGHGPLSDFVSTIERRDLPRVLAREKIDFVCCTTADNEQVALLPEFRGFHVIRDPRDIIVSAYYSHRHSHPTEGLDHLAEHRQRLQQASPEEGLLLEMEFSGPELADMAAWDYTRPDILEIKMETLTRYPYETFVRIFEKLELMSWDGQFQVRARARLFVRAVLNRFSTRHALLAPLRRPTLITGDLLLGRVYDKRFARKATGRKRGQEDTSSHYRKGKSGDWVNHFTPDHVACFKEKFGDLMVRTGYEQDQNWALPES